MGGARGRADADRRGVADERGFADGRGSVNSCMDSSFKRMAFLQPQALQALERFEKERSCEDFRTKNRISLMRNMGKRGTLLQRQ